MALEHLRQLTHATCKVIDRLQRGTSRFKTMVRGRTLINMSSLNSTQLIVDAAQQVGASCALIRGCRSQYQDAADLGHGAEDLLSALRAIEGRSATMLNTPSAAHVQS